MSLFNEEHEVLSAIAENIDGLQSTLGFATLMEVASNLYIERIRQNPADANAETMQLAVFEAMSLHDKLEDEINRIFEQSQEEDGKD